MPLLNKNIILGITGGIAAYKSCELVRLFVKNGSNVRVILTKQGEQFVTPLTLESLSNNPVLRSLGDQQSYDLSATAHIDLCEWGDALVVAPATANFMAKLAHGICDDALLTEALAFTKPIFMAPAMNVRMWEAPITQENRKKLRARKVEEIGPVSGDLACGETGMGKMAEPMEIYQKVAEKLESQPLKGVHVLVTSGPTRTYLDPVRFLTNRSSGRMGYMIARAAEKQGAHVTLISGPVDSAYTKLEQGKTFQVETNDEMEAQALSALPKANIIFSTAAVCDFLMKDEKKGKIPRKETLNLELNSAKDILSSLTAKRKPGQVFMGFAAEVGTKKEQMEKAQDKLKTKGLDFIALNDVSRSDIGFDVDTNELYVFENNASHTFLPKASKEEIAQRLLDIAHTRWSS